MTGVLTITFLLLGTFTVTSFAQGVALFQCTSTNQRLPLEWVCNGHTDCDDGSDEENCVCSPIEFQCDSGQCVSLLWRCDSHQDCDDGSDEVGCGESTVPMDSCYSYEFECASGECIPSVFECDGDDDCADASDERNCTQRICEEHQFMCDSEMQCIPNNWVCDDESDCADMSDETDCDGTSFTCGVGFFNCTNGGCININLVCSGGSPDCPNDASDEENCHEQVCQKDQFKCSNPESGCISLKWTCDGENDCSDGSDEINCDGRCTFYQFECTTGGCANLTSKCDGVLDCEDGSDEFVCPYPPPRIECHDSQYTCLDGQQCIDVDQVCDQTIHCNDGTDELPAVCTQSETNSSCSISNGGCEHLCHTTLQGNVFCTCHHGYELQSDWTSCHDIDECAYPYQCSQLCTNTEGGVNCSCAEGYVNHPTRVCKATGPPAKLLFANRVDIRTFPLNSQQLPSTLIKDLHNCVALDYHYEHGYIYWADITQDVIRRSNMMGADITTIIDKDLDTPSGLAVDWVNDKLYWADSGTSRIEVSGLDGQNRTVLFSIGLGQPRAIVVDPAVGYLFWSDWGEEPKIERSSMDGKNRTVLHSVHIIWPNALTVDYITKSIYWADAKLRIIESSFYDGSSRRPILTEGVGHVFAMTLFENNVYWTEWETLSIFSTPKGIGRYVTELDDGSTPLDNVTEIQTDLLRPMDIHVVHPLRQLSSVNPCAVDNGGCEYLCLLSADQPEGYSCACSTGIEVASNGRSCKPLDSFLLFARRVDIRWISLGTESLVDVILPLANVSGATALDWDDQSDQIFWSDILLNTINVANMDGSNQRVLITNNLQTPAGLAVDWLTHKIYWTDDADSARIEVSDFDGSNRSIVVFDLDNPRDIVVHPTAGLMFWTDWGAYPKIERANLDGSDRVSIVSSNLEYPNGLAIDYELERLYWCDASGRIEYSDFDGINRVPLLINTSLPHPFGLALHQEWIYWTDWGSSSLERAHKQTGGERVTVLDDLDRPMDVHVFHRNRTAGVNHPCNTNNGGCSHLCLSRPSRSVPDEVEASCFCPTGFTLMEDGLNCHSHIANFILFPTDSQLRQVSLDTHYLANVILPVSNFRAAASVDVDIQTDEYYWADSLEAKIFKAPMSGGEPIGVVTTGLLKPESIVIDWIGRNLYWADSILGRIEVMNVETSSRHILFSTDLRHVTSVDIDLKSHLMFWVDVGDQIRRIPAKIERATMDGTNRRTIVTSSLSQPRDITVDNYFGIGARIYWTDSSKGTIECANFEGDDRTIVIEFSQASTASPFDLTISGDYLYWTDTTSNSINRALKSDGSDHLQIVSDLPIVSGIVAVSKTDLYNKESFDHGCDGSQQCSDICLPNVATSIYTCICPTGISLMDDMMTCRKFPSTYILMADRTTIKRISLDDDEDYNDFTIIDGLSNTLVIDYILTSPEDGLVVFADTHYDAIYSTNLNGTDKRTIVSGLNETEGLAVDWINHNIYWTDKGSRTVEVISLDGQNRKTLFNSTHGVHRPRAIVLDPVAGLMFWSDWGDNPKIGRARMDGSHRQAIVTEGIKWPNGLGIDRENRRIYWAEAALNVHEIDSCNYNGGDHRQIIPTTSDNLQHPFGMVFFNGFVFWSDWAKSGVFRARVTATGSSNEVLIQDFHGSRPMQPVVVSVTYPRERELNPTGPCVQGNGGCRYLCLPIGDVSRTCACPTNNPTCEVYAPPDVTTILPVPSTSTSPPTTQEELTDQPTTTEPADTTPLIGQNFGGTVATTTDDDRIPTSALSISEWFMIVFAMLVLLAIVAIIVGAVMFAKWLKSKNKRSRSTPVRLEATNPNYSTAVKFGGPTPLSKLDGESNSINTTKPEKVIGNLLPKRHNNDPRRRPPSSTNANIFIDKPDFFVIPEPQRKKRPKHPPHDSPTLKTPHHSQGAQFEESPSPPLPPKNAQRIPQCSSAPVPKQSNTDRVKGTSKAVRFDASVPTEEDPPALPQRGIPVAVKMRAEFVPKGTNTVTENISGSDCDGGSDATSSTDVGFSSETEVKLLMSMPSSKSSQIKFTGTIDAENMSVESESSC